MTVGRAIVGAWRPAGLFSFLPFILCVLMGHTVAQRNRVIDPRPLPDYSVTYNTAPGTGVLILRLFAERSALHLDRQALLKLVNVADNATTWQTTDDTSQGVFTNVPYGSYDLEVSAVGYLPAHKELQVTNSSGPLEVEVVLQHDPDAINLEVADNILSPKLRKEAKRAISALNSGDLSRAEKQLTQAYKVMPASSQLNFLEGYLYFQKKEYERASTYLETAAKLGPNNGQILTLLGRADLERGNDAAAQSALEEAVSADAENWLPHGLLADAYLRRSNYEKSREEAEVALSKGKASAAPAQLVLAEALIGLGREEEGLQLLKKILNDSPRHPEAQQIRNVITDVEAHLSRSSTAPLSPPRNSVVDPLPGLPPPALVVKPWQPPGIDETKLALASGTACPSGEVLEQSGKRVEELVQDVERFAAVEDLFHQSLDMYGIPVRSETRKYNYVASITEPQNGILMVDEYRTERLALQDYPDHIASQGFAALALVFHPHRRDEFEMACEGLGEWHNQPSWIVHFRQRDDRPNHMHAYQVGNQVHSVALKGRAWITADKFQIVRIEAEMVQPMPEIQLLSEHQIVEYGPVPFQKKNTTLWLPKRAEIYFDFRKHHYYRRHSFDHYMLYSVDTEEKRREPEAPISN